MKGVVTGTLILILGTPVGAVEEPRPQTPSTQYQALLKRYDAPLGRYLNDQPGARAAAEPFLKLARENPEEPVSLDALQWVVTHTLFTPMAGEAMDLLARDHGHDGRLRPIIRDLDRLYGGSFGPMEALLRAALEQSPHRAVRGWAHLALGRYLAAHREEVEQCRVRHAQFLRGVSIPYVAKPEETDEDLEKMATEAQASFSRVIQEYADIDGLGGAAEQDLDALLNLPVGASAPEIEGEDVEGVRFRLSDYRGRVVVLDFWNHTSCGPCRAMYPHLRSLAERLKDRPFTLLGINSDDERHVLKDLKEKGQITWRFWCDGSNHEGPIARRWNVSGWPTVYVLDAKGVIRYKGLQDEALDEAVDKLLDEAPGDQPRPWP